ncbi:MAG: ATP synthase F0 subunit B [Clostridiales bacterium]|nr:ATP synthase F0 subunit B [Clostridiales bacterium]
MTTFLSANLLEVFGLDWKSMLFYLVNFILLIGALVGLVYIPVRKMLRAKRKSLDDVYQENEKLKAETESVKAEYEKITADAKAESARAAAEVALAAQEKADAIIDEAQQKANAIVDGAKKEAAMQSAQLKGEYRESVNTLAVQVAEKLLEREITEKDNADLIEQVLSDWEDN